MTEARDIIKSLKNKRDEMQEQYDALPDKSSQTARLLNDDIEELTTIIKGYEDFLNKYSNVKLDTQFAKDNYERIMDDVLNRLRGFYEGYVNSDDMIKSAKAIDSVIDEIAQTSDSEVQEKKEEAKEEKNEQATSVVENKPQVSSTQSQVSAPVNNNSTEQTQPKKTGSDLQYLNIMDDRIKKIEERLKKLRNRHDFTGRNAEAIRGLEIELEALKYEKEHYQERTKLKPEAEEKLAKMDAEHAENLEQLKEYKEEIKELKELREQLTSKKDIRRIKKLMKNLEAKRINLVIEDRSLTDTERGMMQPGYKDEMKVRTKAARQAGIVSSNQDGLAINEELRSMLDPENNVIDSIKDRFYDIQGNHYRRRIAKAQARMAELQSGNTPIKLNGAKVTSMTQERLENIRNKHQSQLQGQMATQMNI